MKLQQQIIALQNKKCRTVMAKLDAFKSIRQKELMWSMRLHQSTLWDLLDELKQAELVTITKSGRENIVSISPNYYKLLKTIEEYDK